LKHCEFTENIVSKKVIVMRMLALLTIVSATLAGAIFTNAQAREAPRVVSLPTGSNIASWTLQGQAVAPSTTPRQTPVIYLHGGPGMYTEDRRIEMGRAFVEAGFTTIYYDQIGGGQSARIPAKDYTLNRMIEDLEALRVNLGAEKVVLWGNSWGAQLAMLYAQTYPTRVAGFVLTSPGNFPGESFRRDYTPTKRGRLNIPRALSTAITQIDRKGGEAEPAVSQIEAGRLFDAVTSADLLGGMVCKGSNVTQADLPGGGNVFVNRMVQKEVETRRVVGASIPRVPTLIVRGSCDFISSTSANRYAAVTGGVVTPVANIGHGLLEDPLLVQNTLSAFARGPLANLP
jgi:pimeloyl-ACP methyl ester carboxylesterase